MNRINDILRIINDGLKTHYFKDITTYGVTDLVVNKNVDGEPFAPAIYDGNGDYNFIQDDTKGLIIYHRILEQTNEEDLEDGFGRNSLTTESYSIKTVFYGQQIAIEEACEDINYYLANEFKKLIPRRVNIDDTNRIVVTSVDTNKENISNDENIIFAPESILFAINSTITIKTIENCNIINC